MRHNNFALAVVLQILAANLAHADAPSLFATASVERHGAKENDGTRIAQAPTHSNIRQQANGEETAIRDFNLPAQPLLNALKTFAEQADVQLLYKHDSVKGVRANAVIGRYEKHEALKQLLKDTGLEGIFTTDNAATVRPQQPNTQNPSLGAGIALLAQSGEEAAGDAPFRLAQAQGTQATSGERNNNGPAVDNKKSDSASNGSGELIEDVVVTGSRVRTPETASPIAVMNQEEIKRRGLNTAEDIIRSLPQNFSTINAASLQINSNDARGQSAADLRGLGPENTLILVNGRRRAVSSTFSKGVVNLNTIPAGAIERVEIVTDGASAIYGSDAVAGVINFILRKNYQGGETRLRQEEAHNGGDALSATQLLGMNWSTGNITGSGSYTKNDPVDAHKAGFTTSNLTSRGGFDFRDPYASQPGGSFLGSLPADDDGTHGIAGRLSPANTVPFDSGPYTQYATTSGRTLSFDVNAEQKLGTRADMYAELTYSNNKSQSLDGVPSAIFVDVPATNRFNDTGETVSGVGYVFANEYLRGLVPARKFISNQKALGATLGFKFDLPFAGWTLDVSAGHSKEEAYFVGNGINEALFQERVSGLDANGNPIPAAQHLNLFGNGTAQNPAALAGLIAADGFAPASTTTSKLDSGLISAEGALLRLPGGQVRLAVGAELRKEKLDYSQDSSRSQSLVVLEPSRDVQAEFAEASIPIVGDGNRIAGLHSLDLFAAARNEEYKIDGPFDGPGSPDRKATFKRTSQKLGLSWYVVPELKLRATVSDSFRAPQLSELFAITNGPYNFLPIFDPTRPQDGLLFPDFYLKGNPSLGPETARNVTAGVDWKPTNLLQGLSVSATYGKINFTNRISSATGLVFRQPELLFELPGVVERAADGHISRINLMSVNLAARRSENVDLTSTYDFDTAVGDITLGFSGTYAIKLNDIATPGADPQLLAGTEGGPEKHKWRTWISWSRGEYGANIYTNFSGSYTHVNDPVGSPQSVDSYTTYDLTGFYRIDRLGWAVNGGVRNLTNAKFPFFDAFGGPWDSRRVDTRGRVLYLEVVKKYGFPGGR